DRILTAATYGRGIWRLKVHEPFPVALPVDPAVPNDPCPAKGLLRHAATAGPELLLPADAAQVNTRLVTLGWSPVPGAVGYVVRIRDSLDMKYAQATEKPAIVMMIRTSGVQTWRVWAILPDSRRSRGSDEWTFRCLI